MHKMFKTLHHNGLMFTIHFSAQRYTDFLKRTNHSTTFLKIIWNRRREGEESEINLIEISFLEGKGEESEINLIEISFGGII